MTPENVSRERCQVSPGAMYPAGTRIKGEYLFDLDGEGLPRFIGVDTHNGAATPQSSREQYDLGVRWCPYESPDLVEQVLLHSADEHSARRAWQADLESRPTDAFGGCES